jgi:hypothetical protein
MGSARQTVIDLQRLRLMATDSVRRWRLETMKHLVTARRTQKHWDFGLHLSRMRETVMHFGLLKQMATMIYLQMRKDSG